MRISDWSSDVCSSDLALIGQGKEDAAVGQLEEIGEAVVEQARHDDMRSAHQPHVAVRLAMGAMEQVQRQRRSEARRVGKEWVSTCRSRWSPNHSKYKINKNNTDAEQSENSINAITTNR